MAENNKIQSSEKETRKRVFVANAKVLSEEQRGALSQVEKAFEDSCEDRGVWLELFCPDDACFSEEERIGVPVFCKEPDAGKNLWLKVFCPDGSCEITSPAQLA
jgi:hypothetical protein